MLLITAEPQNNTNILWRYGSQDPQYVKLLRLEQAASVENTEMYKELFAEVFQDF